MRFLLLIILPVVLYGCQKDSTLTDSQDAAIEKEKASNCYAYFDSLATYGAKYGFKTVVPRRDYDIVLSSPTESTITLTVLFYKSCVGYISYGSASTDTINFDAGIPRKIVLSGLLSDKQYTYQFHYREKGSGQYFDSGKYAFSTSKPNGRSFSFAIIADSHLDENSDTLTYQATLRNIALQGVDFMLDLGDTFMTDKYGNDYKFAYGQYIAQRYYFGGICHSIPLYFVQGNHDGETGIKKAEMTKWAKQIRESYFPNPSSENYFAWEWGDALFIVLDPFTYTPNQGNKDPWQRTLGDVQYHWLEKTIKNSTKRYKFIFIHNLVGGADLSGLARGGAEIAPYFEWGGYSPNGNYDFYAMRPSWNKPIHDLLKENGVQIVFHGHDHVYAKQNYDGIIYQCVPQPSLKRFENLTYATTYGYLNGTIKYIPGNIKVTLNGSNLKVEYISAKNEVIDTYFSNEIPN